MNTHARRIFASLLSALAFSLWVAAVRSQNESVRSQNESVRRLTSTPAHALNLNPTISGDGRRIAFESTADLTGSRAQTGFHALRADLTAERAAFTDVAASRAPAPAISRDGSRLAFASRENLTGENLDGNSEIFLFADVTVRTSWQMLPRSSYNP